jgi:hypothetical protein
MDTPLFLRVRGRVMGPYDLEKLQSFARRGQLSRMHEVSTDGTHWVRASTYTELFVGTPVESAAPEMSVNPPPPPQSVGLDDVLDAIEEPDRPMARPEVRRKWYYDSDGTEHGPIEESLLKQLLASGQLPPETVVWREGMGQWTAVTLVAELVSSAATAAPRRRSDQGLSTDEVLDDNLCKMACASQPWSRFLAITAFVYAGVEAILGFLMLVSGADHGAPPLVAMGLFWLINSVVVAVGGVLLINYANRLGGLDYGKSPRILTNALDKLRLFWMYVSIVLIVILAFIVFFTIWVIAIGASIARWS